MNGNGRNCLPGGGKHLVWKIHRRKAAKLLTMTLLAVLLYIYFVSNYTLDTIDKEISPLRQVHATVPTKKKSY